MYGWTIKMNAPTCWLLVLAACGMGGVASAEPRVSYCPVASSVLLGAPLDGRLTVTDLTNGEFFGHSIGMSVFTTGTTSPNLRTGVVKAALFRFGQGRLYPPGGIVGDGGCMPGLLWSPDDEKCSRSANGSLIFPEPGDYEIRFSIAGITSDVSRITVLAPTGRVAQAWRALPLDTYRNAFVAHAAAADFFSVTNGNEVVEYLKQYSDTPYATYLQRFIVEIHERRSRRELPEQTWLREAYQLCTNPAVRPAIMRDIRHHRVNVRTNANGRLPGPIEGSP